MFAQNLAFVAFCLLLMQPLGLPSAPIPASEPPQVIYDLDFSAPDHTLDQKVAIGGGPKRVTSAVHGIPTVRNSSGALTARPLEFDVLTSYESVLLRLPQTSPVGALTSMLRPRLWSIFRPCPNGGSTWIPP